MHKIYCSSRNISVDKIVLSDTAQVHHIRDVLRLKTNDEIVVFDGKGKEYLTKIEKIMPKSIILNIKTQRQSTPTKNLWITIACAIPKKSKIDDIVDKLTQLGVDRIIPLLTERVIVKWDKNKKILQYLRWKKITISAAQQSQRNSIAALEPLKDIKDVLAEAQDFDLKLIPTLIGKRKSLREIFTAFKPKKVLVLIGPEGDFTPEELELAKSKGFIPVSLGSLVLRVETAAVAVVSFIRLYTGTVPENELE